MKKRSEQKDTKVLRVINWAFSTALICASLLLIFTATQTGTFYLVIFLLLSIVAYNIPALLLYSGTSKIVGIPIIIDKENTSLYQISIAANFLFLLLGIGIILASVYTGQYIIVILGFITTLLSYSNVKALDICVKELKS